MATAISACTFAAYITACADDDTVAALPLDGGTDATSDTSVATDAGQDTGADAGDPVARGKYLVENVVGCPDCHTPRKVDGSPDMTRYLAGVECFIGSPLDGGTADGGDAGDGGTTTQVGCLNSRNLTNDATGLKNRTDAQIKAMFQTGMRPNGEHLVPVMPYWVLNHLTDSDADAIVAYLRTVPAVNHTVPPNDPPWTFIPQAQPIDMSKIPTPTNAADPASATRGRYLATLACVDCHSPDAPPGSPQPQNMDKAFAGNRAFPAKLLGIPSPPFPAVIYTQNLTQDSTGLLGYDAQTIVRELHQGLDRDGGGICPPMPAGPKKAFGGLTDQDALDIANYVLTIPGINNPRTANCVAP